MELLEEVKLAQKGNKDSFIKLIRNYEKYFYSVSKSILDNDEDCADAIQETILNCYKNIGNLKHPEYFKAWFAKSLINNCYKILKVNKKVVPLNESIEQCSNCKDYELIELKEVINCLDKDLRYLIHLYYFDDVSVKTISKILQIPEGTVKSRLSRGRLKIFNSLKIDKEDCYYEGRING
ncbi:RNA polymerase sigma-70 factor (ECF subfamily) [Clostridium tetanomorphum]|uniref:sigma-70 family RNA polymerase sigma factor n=1 Tax=Clostridium tetanomorphum TaxID=1553 RepID=UPI00044A34E4|nr:sigma-70 family RNA polymerase sigma factor [Clostridium tetanomorphum]KAJ51111.1 RNA polymerase sigma factor [Clostridium tetanomorphum DSM 665]MBP1864461.1 RNA polymerase sigma-70 factor (ECF subfamily) [Clostridium tetanomorphum]NRS83008.1 RNA polymerase sigma-70 factor (ECF subfamily) [Clostridium tetanomorphum]SQC01046.1 RNA polymerase sigma factor [Clostridium tetanomorphum]